MEFYLNSVSKRPYRINLPEELPSPGLVVFRDRVEFNIEKMGELLKAASPGFGFESLWPHAKTHKSKWTAEKLLSAGFSSFKTTPNEVDMLVAAGVKRMFIAYPLVLNEALRIARLAKESPQIEFIVQAASPIHVDFLTRAARTYDIEWQYFIDLDCGMHRTGISPEKAFDFYKAIGENGRMEFAGLHAYDGHNSSADIEERRKTTRASVDPLVLLFRQFENESIRVPKLMMAGTPSFLTNLEYLSRLDLDTRIILSPGTWVYFDTMYRPVLPDTFEVAALILAQVMDRPGSNRATLNLGYKRWSIDQGPVEGFSIEGMKAVGWSEEHTMVTFPGGENLEIGDYVLISPRHVCSTVNLWESFTVLGPDGEIEVKNCPIEGRNR